MAWGITETAPEKEKIKAKFADYIGGLNSCCVINRQTYSELYDFGMALLDEMYNLGIADNKMDKREEATMDNGDIDYCYGCTGYGCEECLFNRYSYFRGDE